MNNSSPSFGTVGIGLFVILTTSLFLVTLLLGTAMPSWFIVVGTIVILCVCSIVGTLGRGRGTKAQK